MCRAESNLSMGSNRHMHLFTELCTGLSGLHYGGVNRQMMLFLATLMRAVFLEKPSHG